MTAEHVVLPDDEARHAPTGTTCGTSRTTATSSRPTARWAAGSGSASIRTARWRGGRPGSSGPTVPASARPTTGLPSHPATDWSRRRPSAPTTPPTSGLRSNSCARSNRSAWPPARPPTSSTRPRPSTRRASRRGPAARLELDLTWTTDGVPYHYDLTTRYEIPCLVTGTVTFGGETFTIDGQGQRDHSWGVRDWWAFGWCWCSVRLEDGTRVHLADIRMGIPDMPVFFGYIQKPERAPPRHRLDGVRRPGSARLPDQGAHRHHRRRTARPRGDTGRLRARASPQRRRRPDQPVSPGNGDVPHGRRPHRRRVDRVESARSGPRFRSRPRLTTRAAHPTHNIRGRTPV